jgi:hypothetical protein
MTVNISKPAINVREKLNELDKPTGIAGQAMLRAETPQEQFNLIGAGRRRINQNGDMRIAQRGTSSTSNGYLVDRYKSYNATGATYTQSQGTTSPPEGFGHYLKINTDTADTSIGSSEYFQLSHAVEGQDVIGSGWGTSSAIPITLSFWVKSNVTGTYAVEIQTGLGGYESSHNYTIDASGVWEYKTVTFPAFTATAIPMDNLAGFILNWWLAAGSTWNTGAISPEWTTGNNKRASGQVNLFAAQNNYWQITGVQLELGKVATPFEHRSYGEELALCQRYYYQTDSSSKYRFSMNVGASTTAHYASWPHPVTMRDEPTVAITATTTDNWSSIGTSGDNSKIALGLAFNPNGTADTRCLAEFHFTAKAEL